MNGKLIGRWGENLAAEYLKRKKYKLVSMGYSCRFGEIDIIARHKKYIVFAEVKLRKNADFGTAGEFVDSRKIGRIRSTAESWLCQNETDLQPRFDVIEIYAPNGVETENPTINHLEDVF